MGGRGEREDVGDVGEVIRVGTLTCGLNRLTGVKFDGRKTGGVGERGRSAGAGEGSIEK